MTGRGTVRFDVPAEVAFDYLADPRNRPEWQSSLRRVELVTGEEVRVGQRWIDVTVPGLRPSMETTELDRPRHWVERGTWRGLFGAVLALDFLPASTGGCDVRFAFRVTGRGPLGVPAAVLTRVAVPAVRGDLQRAAKALARRP